MTAGAEADPPRETADVDTASDDYARRFAGPVGAWFLHEQARATLGLLADFPAGASILDVGGGHAQLAPVLSDAGYRVTVVGSAPEAGVRLAQWVAARQGRFEVADLLALPYPERAFDAVLCFRLLPHSVDWRKLLRALCRVSRRTIVVDYPSSRSVNVVADRLFAWKQRIERNTRPFQLFSPGEIRRECRRHGYRIVADRPQFLWPMVLHRTHGSRALARILEAPGHLLGVTAALGSPVVVRADRRET
ncbi:MAG: class I SAM-dependent methyltransferase [Gemmatimonadales bacterium]